MTINDIRDMFPALGQQVYSRPLVYFDNAATSQRLENAVRRLDGLALGANANIHRAVHKLASDATEEYESTRDAVRDFLNAESREEILFTSGTTASINLVAYSFGETFINEGDEIIVSEEEHHSNIVPWQLLCERKKAVLKVIGIDDEGHLKIDELKTLLTSRTKLVAVTQVSNVLGIVFMIVIFLLGHLINIGLNALGAYVHTMRLQYVEMFSKFYEGGGKEFEPFSLNSKYIKIQEDK